MTPAGVFSWLYQRYINGYSFAGSVMAIFNTVGIFTLVLQDALGLPKFLLMPLLAILGAISFIVLAIIMFDVFKLQNEFQRKSGDMNEYWGKRLTPINKKQTLLLLDAIEHKEKIAEIKKKVEGEYL